MHKSRLALPLLLVALTFAAYGNSLFSDFVGDDVGRILSKKHFYDQGFASVLQNIMPDRPFLTWTVWLNYLFGGMNPVGYKTVNVLLHAGCSVVIFHFLQEIFRKLQKPAQLAFFAAAIFAVHPINNQAVMSVIQRGVLLATLFSLLPYLLLLKNVREGKFRHLFLAVLFFTLALLSKPNALVFPLIFLILLVNFEGLSFKAAFRKCFPLLAVLIIPVVQYAFVTKSQSNAIPGLQYFLVQTKIILFYFSKYFVPVNLQFLYSFDNFPADWLGFAELKYLGLHLAILAVALWLAIKKKSTTAWMVILGYLSFLPESGFFSILHVAFDHRNYIPLLFFAAAFVLLLRKVPYNFAVLAPGIFALGVLNFSYTSKINTFDKWLAYNLQANPENRSFNIYQLAQAVEAGNRERSAMILKHINRESKDREVASLKAFLDYDGLSDSDKKAFVQNVLNFSMDTQVSVHYFYFAESFLRRELANLYGAELGCFAMNSFYFGYLDYWKKYLTAPDLAVRIHDNFRQTVLLSQGHSSPVEKMLGLRSQIAMHRFFGDTLPQTRDYYNHLLENELAERPEAVKLKEWLNK